MSRQHANKEYMFITRPGILSWHARQEHDDTLSECKNCGELTKGQVPFCSLFCRVEHQQKAA